MLPKLLSVKVPLLHSVKDFVWNFSIAVRKAAGDFWAAWIFNIYNIYKNFKPSVW